MRAMASTQQNEAALSRGWLTRGVLGIGLASLFSDWGHELGTALLPVLLAGLGAPAYALGVIEGVADGLSSFAKLAGGWLADRPAWRKPLAVCGYLVTGLSTFAFGFVANWPQVLGARSIGWIGRGIRGPSRDVLLTQAVPAGQLGRAFGFERAMDTLGAVLGPLTATALVAATTVSMAMRWTLLPGALAALTIGVFVRDAGRAGAGHAPREGFFSSLRALPAPFSRVLGSVFVFGLGDFAKTLLILRASILLAPRYGAIKAGAFAVGLYTLHNVFYALASFPAGALGDRGGQRGLLAASYLLSAATFAGFAFTGASLPLLAVLFALTGISVAGHDTLEKSLSAELLPAERRGTGFGALATVNGVGDFISSITVGVLWSAVSPGAGFAYAAGCTALGAALLFLR
jgi:MFS family permease